MGKGYKRKTRWRTLNIGAPPGEEDEEDGIRNGYAKGQENGTSSRNGQPGHKAGRTDSAGSTTSDYASDYASAASRSRRDDSGGSPTKPKIIFDENEYTRITTPRQDVLFKKGYLSRKKVWASTASTSATPSTTESQSASHSTADGSETTEDQQLLDYKENGAEEYPGIAEAGGQVAYGSFYDHASGYYYEYPVMLVGPGGGMPGPPMHNVLTAVPCGPVPLRPIEWVNPAYVPKLGNQQYCVMDYQTAHLAQYPTLVDENGVPLTGQTDNTNGCEEGCFENGTGSASLSASPGDEEQQNGNGNDKQAQIETKNGTTESVTDVNEPTAEGKEETTEAAINSELYMENALAQQLQVTHVAVPPVLQPYMYPGHYMFGPSLVNVNGVTIQSGPMVRNTGVTGGPASTGACAKRKKKKKLSKRKSRRPVGPGNGEDEEQEEEYSSESENLVAAASQPASDQSGAVAVADAEARDKPAATSGVAPRRPLNPECQEFRPIVEARKPVEVRTRETSTTSQTSSDPLSSVEASDEKSANETATTIDAESSRREADSEETIARRAESVREAAPIEFATEVFATTIAERALASRGVVDGTPMETEIGLDATSIDFRAIAESATTSDVETRASETQPNEAGSEEDAREGSTSRDVETIDAIGKRQRASNETRVSRSASPGMINRTTTPINSTSQRLPESYESLVVRGATGSTSIASLATAQQTTTRNRKYSGKGAKFVREATPGPDLDVTQLQAQIRQTSVEPEESIRMRVLKSDVDARDASTIVAGHGDNIDAEAVEAIEAELQSYSATTGSFSNDDSGVEIQRLSTEHPITDAVTEWLQRANSPELFVTSGRASESEPDDDELDDETSKNLEGNPTPALSANSDDADDRASSRRAGDDEFANGIEPTELARRARRNEARLAPRRRRRTNVERLATTRRARRLGAEDARERNESEDVCELIDEDRVAGVRVAKSSRKTARTEVEERSTSRDRTAIMLSGRAGASENVDVKVRVTNDDGDEGIVEDEEIPVRTYEKGEIIVSKIGKVIPFEACETVAAKNRRTRDGEASDAMKFRTITCEKCRRDETDTSAMSDDASKRNSLGSIEEPDVLECWEIETVEPVATPSRSRERGTCQRGEAAEDDEANRLDGAAVEIVRKYYRLEATRDSGTSVTSLDDDDGETSLRDGNSRLDESLCSPEIPVVGERSRDIVEKFLNDAGIPIDEAVEIYESRYNGKYAATSVNDLRTILSDNRLFARNTNGSAPCKAACCNIQ